MIKREYIDYLQDISDAIGAVEKFTRGMNKTDFVGDLKMRFTLQLPCSLIIADTPLF
jgi:uncharacterized protein with HEPN domain